MSPDETRRLLAVATSFKAGVLLSLGYGCSLRAGEVVRLKVKDIDRAQNIIRVEQSKGRKDRHVMLSPKMLALLRHVGIALAARRACPQEIEHPQLYGEHPTNIKHLSTSVAPPSCEARSAGPASMSMSSCDVRITLYPAAPLRLATLLHARTIAREGWGSSTQRQIGQAKSAMVFASHTPDPPNAPLKGASEPLAIMARTWPLPALEIPWQRSSSSPPLL